MRKRNLLINIRVTENEKSNICSKAKRSGISLSEYIRTNEQIVYIEKQRQRCYNKMRRCK